MRFTSEARNRSDRSSFFSQMRLSLTMPLQWKNARAAPRCITLNSARRTMTFCRFNSTTVSRHPVNAEYCLSWEIRLTDTRRMLRSAAIRCHVDAHW